MRSVVKFFLFTFVIVFFPSLIMLIISYFGASTALLILGQILVILSLTGFFLLYLKKEKEYEKNTLEKISLANDIEKLRELRDKRISYRSKAEITKKILNIEYSEEELKLLKKYGYSKEDMDFYYARLIKEDRANREENKIKRDNFNKRYKNKYKVYIDFREVLLTAIKWTVVFAIFSMLAISKIYYKFVNPYWAYAISMLLFLICGFLAVNTIIWIVRALKAFWIKDYI
ncbi:MAG: hypothetical protein PUG67_00435 [Peptoniphilaceae bacterium]|nr:hypothetical protein [Peptoniphilaceae bacterium]MDY6018754.1 hypothetical protein [Anaerococcus sp.]